MIISVSADTAQAWLEKPGGRPGDRVGGVSNRPMTLDRRRRHRGAGRRHRPAARRLRRRRDRDRRAGRSDQRGRRSPDSAILIGAVLLAGGLGAVRRSAAGRGARRADPDLRPARGRHADPVATSRRIGMPADRRRSDRTGRARMSAADDRSALYAGPGLSPPRSGLRGAGPGCGRAAGTRASGRCRARRRSATGSCCRRTAAAGSSSPAAAAARAAA